MCGLLGYFSNQPVSHERIEQFRKALSLISHRGPDSSTELFLQNAVIGFNRLSIVGVNSGDQPFISKDTDRVLLCNGEIYNYRELKSQLKTRHAFSTRSDCEIILHLYEDYPKTFVSKLRGQFAFILYDQIKNQVILARDRFGINPLFYAQTSAGIFVASEIKSLLAMDKGISLGLDPQGLKETLFLYGPTPPRTCFQHVYQVEPGKEVVFDLKRLKVIHNRRYWCLPPQVSTSHEIIKTRFRQLLTQAVDRRIQGDANNPAVYLSGGVDSASVACLLYSRNALRQAISVRFHDRQFDEYYYQRILVRKFSINHDFVYGDNLIDNTFFQTIWHTEHPLIRTAPLPLYHLSQLSRKLGHKYVCCGEGADEMLLGYPVFFESTSSIEDKLLPYSKLDQLFVSQVTGSQLVKDQLLSTNNSYGVKSDSIRSKQLVEIDTKLSRYLLVQQGDRLSMSHSIEQRFPFLDEDLVDFLFSIPDQVFTTCYSDKRLLRSLMKNRLPPQIANRQKKGYLSPMGQQMYASKWFSQLVRLLDGGVDQDLVANYYNQDYVGELVIGYSLQSLDEIEAIGLLLVVSTIVLHHQFFD